MLKKSIKQRVGTPCILLILDGWGVALPGPGNAISLAKTPVMDRLMKTYPHTMLQAYGKYVGLTAGQPGNSEAGHINMGAGRIVDQEAVRISKAIKDGSFFINPVFIEAARHVTFHNSALHLMGMITQKRSGHADPDHLYALIKFAREQQLKKVYLHLFTDGRDSSPHAALKLIEALIRELRGEMIVSIMGRFYAMDRKKFWKRTEAAYHAMVLGKGLFSESPQAAITESYNRNQTDEFIPPYVLQRNGKTIATIQDRDAIIFFNFRSDRARQLTKAFVQKDFERGTFGLFTRKKTLKDIVFVAMTDFGPDLEKIITAYPSINIHDSLPVALDGMKQLYIAESEKYAHVNYFFNGGYPDPVSGEDRIRIESPDVESYDQTPKMSSEKITRSVLYNIKKYDFIVANFANVDMMGHTGNMDAAKKAVECVDSQVGMICNAVLKIGGTMIVTSDHGNAEYMKNEKTGEIVTEHTANLVPFILVTTDKNIKLKKTPLPVSAVAPTVLKLLARKIPDAMTTQDLLR